MDDLNGHSYHSIFVDPDKCVGHMHCMRSCPTASIRVRNGKAKMINDRCIDCGECINACDVKAIIPRTDSFTDFSRFKYIIAIPSPSLYAQFPREILPLKIQKGLLNIGFNEVVDISDTCEAVSSAIVEFLKTYKGPKPLITAFCPTIIRLVQVKYPELVENLLPIESPREIASRELKKTRAKGKNLKEEEIGLIYITPCPSKMIAIKEHSGHGQSSLDGAISISDIYGPLLQAMSGIEIKEEEKLLKQMSSFGLSWQMLGGVTKFLNPEKWLAVSGIHDTIKILSDIEDRKISAVDIIDCFACVGGCIGGSLTIDDMYLARSKVIRLVNQANQRKKWPVKKIQALHEQGYFNIAKKIYPRPPKPLDKDISKAIEKMKEKEAVFQSLPKIDCGACGSPSCLVFAEDVVLGHSKITDCFFKREELSKKKVKGIIKLT